MNEEMKRRPRPANLRTGRAPIVPTSPTPTEAVEEKKKNEFFSFHIGETSFHAGDANGKLTINLSGGLDVDYNATTTEEKKSAEEELKNKIGAVFETLKNITPPPAPTTDTVTSTPTTPSTPNPTPITPTPIPVPPTPTPSWNPWDYRPRPTCSQPGSGSEPKPITPTTFTPEPTENGKDVVKKPPVAPASTNNPTEKPITRKEYKMLVNSMYGMQDTILELNKTIETCIRSIENFISANK